MRLRIEGAPLATVRDMPSPELIDALPDLVLVVKRDGTPVAHAGGRAVPELGSASADGFVPAWSETTAALVRRLVRHAIADRAPVEARFRERDEQYEVRVTPQGPDRAICVVRPALAAATGGAGGNGRASAAAARSPRIPAPLQGIDLGRDAARASRRRGGAVRRRARRHRTDHRGASVSEQIMSTALVRLPAHSRQRAATGLVSRPARREPARARHREHRPQRHRGSCRERLRELARADQPSATPSFA